MPRNLAVFSIGFIVYFSGKTALFLARAVSPPETVDTISNLVTVVLICCYACWILLVNPSGESVPTTLGHRWNTEQQERLMRELEAMNNVLARSARN